jgi:membrane protein
VAGPGDAGSPAPAAGGIGGLVARVEHRVRPLADRILALPPAVLVLDLMERYGAAGGGVTAAGLAYSAIVAILPTLLLLVSILGFLIADPEQRDQVLEALAAQIPPLEDLISEMLEQISQGAWTFSIIGIIGVVWGASRVYAALDTSVALFFPREPRRDIVRQTIESLACVGFFMGSVLGGAALLLFVADLSIVPSGGPDQLVRRLIAVVLMTAWFVGALFLAYWYVPARRVPWRDAAVPALVAGVVVSAVTQIFAIIAPIFFRSLAIYGTFVALFAALVWLSLCTQVVLLGVAWIARRVNAPRPTRPGSPETLGADDAAHAVEASKSR